ncbi:Dolichyl-phosphate-mannose--protein mannosyltransferase 1 [Entomophthora muscae]|uniref:Dolichyl-phosphate-mannose--protein mannosyltransferase 1 n=1 Tax=Entomophthora muscae TaxID=34485 RepID=A0ACC2TLB4_9FUNG|nr:Dolichyl-phosphate-mannose--protein mannosyltransferase 1 [Entomophthora muscae]
MGRHSEQKGNLDFDEGDLKYNKALAPHFDGSGWTSSSSILNMRKADWNILGFLAVVGLLVRLFHISHPDSVVFDEVHFGGFASKYITRNYFFDVHPPLAKLMIAAVAWMSGFDGSFDFSDIGKTFVGTEVPYVAMRTGQAFLAGCSSHRLI